MNKILLICAVIAKVACFPNANVNLPELESHCGQKATLELKKTTVDEIFKDKEFYKGCLMVDSEDNVIWLK